MITATQVRHIIFPGTANIHLFRFTIPSLNASSISDEIKFVLNGPAKIENFRIACASKNFHFSLRLESGVLLPSIEEIYKVIDCYQTEFDDHLDLFWAKPPGADENNLYAYIQNNDGVATGTITFEFVMVCY